MYMCFCVLVAAYNLLSRMGANNTSVFSLCILGLIKGVMKDEALPLSVMCSRSQICPFHACGL